MITAVAIAAAVLLYVVVVGFTYCLCVVAKLSANPPRSDGSL